MTSRPRPTPKKSIPNLITGVKLPIDYNRPWVKKLRRRLTQFVPIAKFTLNWGWPLTEFEKKLFNESEAARLRFEVDGDGLILGVFDKVFCYLNILLQNKIHSHFVVQYWFYNTVTLYWHKTINNKHSKLHKRKAQKAALSLKAITSRQPIDFLSYLLSIWYTISSFDIVWILVLMINVEWGLKVGNKQLNWRKLLFDLLKYDYNLV